MFAEKIEAIKNINHDVIFWRIMQNEGLQQQFIDYNQAQLLGGKGAHGGSLPRYEDDPYFKTQKAAKAYEAWKEHISPDTSKDPEVMDFFIDGTFHDTIMVILRSTYVTLASDSPIGEDVMFKTGNEALGLNPDSIGAIAPMVKELYLAEYKREVNAIIYGRS